MRQRTEEISGLFLIVLGAMFVGALFWLLVQLRGEYPFHSPNHVDYSICAKCLCPDD